MIKISEQKALEAYPPEYEQEDFDETWDMNIQYREPYIEGYDQALCDIKQRIKEIIEHQEKEWGKPNVDVGLYTILGHIIEKEEEYCKPFNEDENSYHRDITKIEVTL